MIILLKLFGIGVMIMLAMNMIALVWHIGTMVVRGKGEPFLSV